jgi:hypothetical protein
VFWRASVATWKDDSRTKRVRIHLGTKYEEEIRQYLLGQTAIPRLAFLTLYVCSDADSGRRSFAPAENEKTNQKFVGFLVRGLEFILGIGKSVPSYQRSLSLTNSADQWIHRRDCMKHSMWSLRKAVC